MHYTHNVGCATSLYVTVFKKEAAAGAGSTDYLLVSMTYVNLGLMVGFVSHATFGLMKVRIAWLRLLNLSTTRLVKVCWQSCARKGVFGLMAPGIVYSIKAAVNDLGESLRLYQHKQQLKRSGVGLP
jgi:hypothetical protein